MASEKDDKSRQAKPMWLPRSPFVSPARKAGELALKPLADMLGARGFAGPEIIAQWPAIVGADLAAFTAPDRIQWPRHDPLAGGRADGRDCGATLYLHADGPGAIEVQHMADVIVQRVNRFLGFQAVSRLRIVQAPVHRPRDGAQRQEKQHPVTATGESVPVAGIAEPRLAAALGRLGAAIRAARR